MNKKILTAHQPVYLPWLGLFHKIACADEFVYFDDVQYQTRDFNNRNKIKTDQGDLFLTVPVLNKNHFDIKVKDVQINNDVPWRKKHLKSIKLAYSKAKYFDRYVGFYEEVYSKDWKLLSDLNEYMLKFFLKDLGIEIKYSRLSDYQFSSSKSELVLDMCKEMKVDHYVFGALGRDYAKEADFANENISISFQDYKHPVYSQLHGEFLPFMSILDLLFNCGDNSLEVLMSGNISKKDISTQYFKEEAWSK